MKKIVAIILIMNLCFSLCACVSSTKTEAKEKFKNENYEDVVAILENEESLDDEMAEMLAVAKANVAYSNNQYMEVVSLLKGKTSDETMEIYSKSLDLLLDEAVNEYDVELLMTLYQIDASIEDYVFEKVINKANLFEYAAFCYIDELVINLPDGYLKNKLQTYSENNEKTRVKAFLRGEWRMVYQSEEGDDAVVDIHVYENDKECVAFLINVPSWLEKYYYEKNDLYWQDFRFEGNLPVSINTLVRSMWGGIEHSTASFELNMEKGEIYIHVTGTDVSDRVWEKIL